MKKSNFLKSSKELLSRSFNPSKCKTALKLAGSRVKLLRNKKEAQVKQLKREIAQLLESGQDQTARIRVEHVVREEKMMAAYDLIEIYCELIAARMQIIESQKICPNDLKEAITSVLYASPRCEDIPELKDLKKHFTEKYGKDFVTAAVELRPQSGVSRLLIEKLSATAPDGPTKIKILSAIAEEHNVKWDPKSFEEKDPTPLTELSKGPRTFEETHLQVETSRTESPDVQAPQSNHRTHGSPSSLSHMDHISSPQTGNHTSAPTSGVNTAFHHESRTLGDERSPSSPGDSNKIQFDRQRWNMEFKDATAAAQAAAESAELASMAARAAAELSSRDKFMRQYSTESHNSDTHAQEHRGPDPYVDSKSAGEQFFEQRRNRSFLENTGLQNEQIEGGRFNENSHRGRKEFTRSTSSIHDNALDHDAHDVYGHSRKNSFPEVSRGETNARRRSFKYANAGPETDDDVREVRISNDVNVSTNYEDRKFKSEGGVDPFLSSGNGGIYGEASYESSTAVFDKSDSDRDNRDFTSGPTYDDHEPEFHSSSQKSREYLSVNPDPWTRKSSSGIGNPASSLFSTRKDSSDAFENGKSVDGSNLNDSVRMTFDESASDSDVDTSTSSRSGIEDYRNLPSIDNRSVRQHIHHPALKNTNSEIESNDIGMSSHDDGVGLNLGKLTGGLRHKGNNPPPFLKIQKDRPSSFGEKAEGTTATITRPAVPASTEIPRTSTIHEHKKSQRTRDFHPGSDSDSSKEEESLRNVSGQKPRQYTPSAGKEVKPKLSFAASNSYFSSDNSDSDEDPPKESLIRTRQKQNVVSQRTKPSSFSSVKDSYSRMRFGSETHDFDKEMDGKTTTLSSETPNRFESSKLETSEQQPTSSKVASKPSRSNFWGPPEPYSSGKAASLTTRESKTRHGSEPHDFDADVERKPMSYYTPETRHLYPSLTKTSSQLGNSDPRTSGKAASKPSNKSSWGTSDQHYLGKPNSITMQESKKTPNWTAKQESSTTRPRTEAASVENLKATATLTRTSSNNDGSNQRASHVHPKLPDYDTLVQTLRKNRP